MRNFKGHEAEGQTRGRPQDDFSTAAAQAAAGATGTAGASASGEGGRQRGDRVAHAGGPRQSGGREGRRSRPTKREIQVMEALGRYQDYTQATKSLRMALGTFRRHLSDLIVFYAVDNAHQAVRAAQREGLVTRELPALADVPSR